MQKSIFVHQTAIKNNPRRYHCAIEDSAVDFDFIEEVKAQR
jgi:hypothetical protein